MLEVLMVTGSTRRLRDLELKVVTAAGTLLHRGQQAHARRPPPGALPRHQEQEVGARLLARSMVEVMEVEEVWQHGGPLVYWGPG